MLPSEALEWVLEDPLRRSACTPRSNQQCHCTFTKNFLQGTSVCYILTHRLQSIRTTQMLANRRAEMSRSSKTPCDLGEEASSLFVIFGAVHYSVLTSLSTSSLTACSSHKAHITEHQGHSDKKQEPTFSIKDMPQTCQLASRPTELSSSGPYVGRPAFTSACSQQRSVRLAARRGGYASKRREMK